MIWINEQVDGCGIVHACIACQSEAYARDCHQSFQDNLTEAQKQAGWMAQLRTVQSWDEVPVIALKLG
ncbi:glycogen debranching protein [Romeria aff. gracilis LEGE 07310]|uniref:Glycogen debranching protein n=1 Tax=Vasconcelosia minhoensis LEGE 07310 TaxID=915328 RepID=A0A8J7AHW9_9CYAN|nr:glycogen debranching protein [Romeria gracilis]MBE9079259.1 glycogen debranching protein [Romeria aff. gracilis LEGE 07310]